jgi:hypothetical protein
MPRSVVSPQGTARFGQPGVVGPPTRLLVDGFIQEFKSTGGTLRPESRADSPFTSEPASQPRGSARFPKSLFRGCQPRPPHLAQAAAPTVGRPRPPHPDSRSPRAGPSLSIFAILLTTQRRLQSYLSFSPQAVAPIVLFSPPNVSSSPSIIPPSRHLPQCSTFSADCSSGAVRRPSISADRFAAPPAPVVQSSAPIHPPSPPIRPLRR